MHDTPEAVREILPYTGDQEAFARLRRFSDTSYDGRAGGL
jgi:hypothetical protein